jgi:hypothetical protein
MQRDAVSAHRETRRFVARHDDVWSHGIQQRSVEVGTHRHDERATQDASRYFDALEHGAVHPSSLGAARLERTATHDVGDAERIERRHCVGCQAETEPQLPQRC